MNTTLFNVLDLLAKSAGILLLAFAVQSLWRGASAAQRCVIWLAAFAVVLLLPLTLLLQPRWSIDVAKPKPAMLLPEVKSVITMPAEAVVPAAPQTAPTWKLQSWSLAQWLGFVWLGGVVLLVAQRIAGSIQLRALKSRSELIDDARLSESTARIASEFGLRRHIELRTASCVAVPLTWGFIKPVLLLPSEALQWNDARLEAALRHEIGHIRHGDALTRWLMFICCTLHWPNALLWVAARAWRTAQEQACDDLVVNAGASSEDYALQLLDAARAVQPSGYVLAPVLAMARPSTLEARLTSIMDATRNRRPLQSRALLIGAASACVVLGLCASTQLRAEAKNKKQTQQVLIATRFIEITGNEPLHLPELNIDENEAAIQSKSQLVLGGVMTPAQMKTILEKLSKIPGMDLLSAPSMTTKSGQKATVQVGRELTLDEARAEKTFIGVSLEALPKVFTDGTIELALAPLVRDLKGYETKGGAKRPILQERKSNTSITLWDGQTVFLGGGSDQKDGKARRLLVFITAKVVADDDAKAVPAPPAPAARAAKIVFPSVEFRDATLTETIEFIRLKSRELDPEKKGANILLNVPANHKAHQAKLALSLHDIPLDELLIYVTELAGVTCTMENNAIVILPAEPGGGTVRTHDHSANVKAPAHKIDELLTRSLQLPADAASKIGNVKEWLTGQGVKFPEGASAMFISSSSQLIVKLTETELTKVDAAVKKLGGGDAPPEKESAALKKAQAIIFPTIQFHDASIAECVEFLQIKSKDLDPKKEGVNLILKNEAVVKDVKVTLSMTNIPLSEVLRYVTALSNMDLKSDEHAFVLEPKAAVK